MTRTAQVAQARQLLHKLEQARNSTAEHVTDDSRDKAEILAGLDGLITRARALLAGLGQADSPPVAQAPEALQ